MVFYVRSVVAVFGCVHSCPSVLPFVLVVVSVSSMWLLFFPSWFRLKPCVGLGLIYAISLPSMFPFIFVMFCVLVSAFHLISRLVWFCLVFLFKHLVFFCKIFDFLFHFSSYLIYYVCFFGYNLLIIYTTVFFFCELTTVFWFKI